MPNDMTWLPQPDTAPDKEKRELPAPEPEGRRAPRAGRTGLAGSRAERPSDGNTRNTEVPVVGRGGKAPSAKERKGEAKDDEELPP